MISDNATNYLFLADTLLLNYPNFYSNFIYLLKSSNIEFSLLHGTKDIWAVDYMPIQIDDKKFIQFIYNPTYLHTKELMRTISDVDSICNTIRLKPNKSSILLDGGNVIRHSNKVIITDRVFTENKNIKPNLLRNELENLFETDQLIIIPKEPYEMTGHADGLVRFLNDDTVLINDYSVENPQFKIKLVNVLTKAKLNIIEIPYCPEKTPKFSARGLYINYLQMQNRIIMPVFDLKEDEYAVRQMEQLFTGVSVKTINCTEIARAGGLLNCISWNIKIHLN